MKIAAPTLKAIFPKGQGLDAIAGVLETYAPDFGIGTAVALAHFLAQAGEETGGFARLAVTENMNYSAKRLVVVWPKRFSLTKVAGKALAGDYANAPEKLGNLVYASRMGNGDVASGDGYRFRGRGVFQLTGRSNYTAFENFYNAKYSPHIAITTDPSPVADDVRIAVLSALWYFSTRVLASVDIATATVKAVTKKVNGGDIGLAGRTAYYKKAVDVLGKPQPNA